MSNENENGTVYILQALGVVLLFCALTGGCADGCSGLTDDDLARYGARETIKQALKDPDSFRFVSEEKSEMGWIITYRAKNGFGGVVTEQALVTPNGTIIQ